MCSTVPASYAQSVAEDLVNHGREDIHLIDAPVSGGALRAANGTLSIMAGAPDAALESGRFLLEAMSDANKLYLVPGGIGAGSNMKMVHQVLAGIHILGASEAMGFAAHLGLNADTTAEAIKESSAWTWMHENRLQRMVEEDWTPGASALTIILKDVVSALNPFRENGFDPLNKTAYRGSSPLPLARTISPPLFAPQPSKSTSELFCRAMDLWMIPLWFASTSLRLSGTSQMPKCWITRLI